MSASLVRIRIHTYLQKRLQGRLGMHMHPCMTSKYEKEKGRSRVKASARLSLSLTVNFSQRKVSMAELLRA